MIFNLSRMCRNVNRKVYNDREKVSATPVLKIDLVYLCQEGSREQMFLTARLALGIRELLA